MDGEKWANALRALQGLLGPGGVDETEPTTQRYARSTSRASTTPRAVVFPANAEQVKGVVEIARAHDQALHPISRGRNWGYGDAAPPGDGQIIVDLGRMDRILEVNEQLAYAIIEPGVTQGQLFDHLRTKYIKLWMDCTGAGREASIIGNALERGFGHTPYSDHFAQLRALEIVLGSERVVKTRMGRLPGSR